MQRALIKGAGLFSSGVIPGGERAYRYITRRVMGSQAGHVTKLRRVWPIYVSVLSKIFGGSMDGLRVWDHEPGWTPYLALLNYITTGEGGSLINTRISGASVLDRHATDSINQAMAIIPRLADMIHIPDERQERIDGLRFCGGAREMMEAVGCRYQEGVDPERLPLDNASMDLMHCGGQFEHYTPAELSIFLREARRILRPGGMISAVVDHRDHLFHFDPKLPFLFHYSQSDGVYRVTRSSQLLYHNRLTPAEFSAALERAGFHRVGLRRLTLPDHSWNEEQDELQGRDGLDRHLLAPRFREISDRDLKTAAAHYIYSNPA